MTVAQARYREAYAALRAREGRGSGGEEELHALPYLSTGPLARQWGVRARTFDAFVERVLQPLERLRNRPLRILDLGAGNGWLAARLASRGHIAFAVDIRADDIDGLGAAALYARTLGRMFHRVVASFDAIPFHRGRFDLVVFNAALHYAHDLETTLGEAVRILETGGRIAILDSPFYRQAKAGDEMVKEKRESTRRSFPDLADALLEIPSIEYLTRKGLNLVAHRLRLTFRRYRVRYPFWYEVRPLVAFLRRRRTPSRFDLWEGRVA